MIDTDRFAALLEEYGIAADLPTILKLDDYAKLLVERNREMNLTAITEPEEIETKHFLDSLLTGSLLKGDERFIDVGTGAGFPGMVLKIVYPHLEMSLLDGLEKRLDFLRDVAASAGVRCRFVHARAEDAGHDPALRECFDAAAARAVAPLNVLCEYCLPFVAVGGTFYAMKGSSAAEELDASQTAVRTLGGEIAGAREFTLPDGSSRNIILIKKIMPTDEKYPRRAPVIKKKPL